MVEWLEGYAWRWRWHDFRHYRLVSSFRSPRRRNGYVLGQDEWLSRGLKPLGSNVLHHASPAGENER